VQSYPIEVTADRLEFIVEDGSRHVWTRAPAD
jgi:hypothetical protein